MKLIEKIKKIKLQNFSVVTILLLIIFGCLILIEVRIKIDHSKKYTKEKCLKLTEIGLEYKDAVKKILELDIVKDFKIRNIRNNIKDVSLVIFYSEPKYIKNKCFWYITLEENHKTHLVLWKSFLVDVDNFNIYEGNIKENLIL
jgi:hypothetical protein